MALRYLLQNIALLLVRRFPKGILPSVVEIEQVRSELHTTDLSEVRGV